MLLLLACSLLAYSLPRPDVPVTAKREERHTASNSLESLMEEIRHLYESQSKGWRLGRHAYPPWIANGSRKEDGAASTIQSASYLSRFPACAKRLGKKNRVAIRDFVAAGRGDPSGSRSVRAPGHARNTRENMRLRLSSRVGARRDAHRSSVRERILAPAILPGGASGRMVVARLAIAYRQDGPACGIDRRTSPFASAGAET